MGKSETRAFLLEQRARYPLLDTQDLLKALHQSVFGCGHFVTDEAAGLALLQQELQKALLPDGPEVEVLDGPFRRVHLRTLLKTGLSPRTLFRIFCLSAGEMWGDAGVLEEKLSVLLELVREGRLPKVFANTAAEVDAWRKAGFPACHHSEGFRSAYQPAYRVVHKRFAEILPLLAAIDRKLVEQKRVLLAIEGGSAAGKTTLAALLEQIYGCTVFHMDDFFLRPEQRTAERLAQPGGNVDAERFLEEVLESLSQGQPVCYRRYDCHTQLLGQPETLPATALSVVEGAYSMHPLLAEQYDLSVFLRISPQLQHDRILRRNGPEVAERFFTQWIPLEQLYFDALRPAERCDLIWEVEA